MDTTTLTGDCHNEQKEDPRARLIAAHNDIVGLQRLSRLLIHESATVNYDRLTMGEIAGAALRLAMDAEVDVAAVNKFTNEELFNHPAPRALRLVE